MRRQEEEEEGVKIAIEIVADRNGGCGQDEGARGMGRVSEHFL